VTPQTSAWQAPPQAAGPSYPAVAMQLDGLDSKLNDIKSQTDRNQQLFNDAVRHLEQNQLLHQILQGVMQRPAALPAPAAPSEAAPTSGAPLAAPASEAPPPPPTVEMSIKPSPRAPAEAPPAAADGELSIQVENEDIRKVLAALGEASGLNILPSNSVTGTVSVSLNGVDANTALDAILKSAGLAARREKSFIFVGTRSDFDAHAVAHDQVATRVYRPNYSTAAELQKLITPLLTPTVGKMTVSSPAKVDIPADSAKTGGDDFTGNEVVLVSDYESVLAQVDQIVAEVDRRPRQVVIEAVIMSVDLNDRLSLGVDFELLRDRNNARLVSGAPLSDLGGIEMNAGALSVGFLDSSLGAFVNALETVGDTNVIASPRVLCLNKQRAEILIGEQLGYVSTTVTQTAATQTVEFLEVGTQLRIRPFIGSDGMVRLEVHPELSDGTVEVQGNFTLPNKRVTQVTTNIMCRDGCTVVLGGLIRENLNNTSNQFPLFGSLPYVGALFRHKDEEIRRSELIVLLTPRIVVDEVANQEAADAHKLFTTRQANYFEKMSPLGKRHFGLKYRQMAQAAWNTGDAWAAFRYVNMAIHFDPMNPEATRLREEIRASGQVPPSTVHSNLHEGLAPWHHPHVEYSRHGVPFQGPPPPPPGMPIEMAPVFENTTPTPITQIVRPAPPVTLEPIEPGAATPIDEAPLPEGWQIVPGQEGAETLPPE
jgi:type IV pilus assembly protein PilQ